MNNLDFYVNLTPKHSQDKPQGKQREKHTRITKKILTFVSFVKTLVSFVVKIFFLSLPNRFLTIKLFKMTTIKLFTHWDSRLKISGMIQSIHSSLCLGVSVANLLPFTFLLRARSLYWAGKKINHKEHNVKSAQRSLWKLKPLWALWKPLCPLC